MPFYVEYKIFAKMTLTNGSEVYENWIKPPVTPRMMLYVFNVTNHEAFLAGNVNKQSSTQCSGSENFKKIQAKNS